MRIKPIGRFRLTSRSGALQSLLGFAVGLAIACAVVIMIFVDERLSLSVTGQCSSQTECIGKAGCSSTDESCCLNELNQSNDYVNFEGGDVCDRDDANFASVAPAQRSASGSAFESPFPEYLSGENGFPYPAPDFPFPVADELSFPYTAPDFGLSVADESSLPFSIFESVFPAAGDLSIEGVCPPTVDCVIPAPGCYFRPIYDHNGCIITCGNPICSDSSFVKDECPPEPFCEVDNPMCFFDPVYDDNGCMIACGEQKCPNSIDEDSYQESDQELPVPPDDYSIFEFDELDELLIDDFVDSFEQLQEEEQVFEYSENDYPIEFVDDFAVPIEDIFEEDFFNEETEVSPFDFGNENDLEVNRYEPIIPLEEQENSVLLCSRCGECGEGVFNTCDKNECMSLGFCIPKNRVFYTTCVPDGEVCGG
ncbi:hypothetical protein KJ652_03995 [Patescibacteria group bacterium]|nr:hypothetical protein [Patescibacteria group bacterium]MBU1123727.1 hypothetical protein [Patescibacteria group bacterium]